MKLLVILGCAVVLVASAVFPVLWDRRPKHACRFESARIAESGPGRILTCPFCGEPARVDEDGFWTVAMSWREKRHWRRGQRRAQR